MKIDLGDFRVPEGSHVELEKWASGVKPLYEDGAAYHEAIDKAISKIDELQQLLYATGGRSLLVILQAMDAAGKDGAIRHVFSGINPQGCEVHSFKQPSAEELAHDFLWRTYERLPGRGRIGVFNRSYYEEVLVVRVHPEILRKQGLPPELVDEKRVWKERFESIADMERHLSRNGTAIVKIFLHVSKAEQKKRLLSRIDDEAKNWKFSDADLAERALWKKYMKAYGECLSATSSKCAPWYVVPADDKKNAHLIIAEIVKDALKGMKMHYPQTDEARAGALKKIRSELAAD